MKTFSIEVREAIVNAQAGICDLCAERIHSIHHKLSNTKVNQKRYPLFVQSIFNGVGLCGGCHTNHHARYNIPYPMVDAFERYLENERERHPNASK